MAEECQKWEVCGKNTNMKTLSMPREGGVQREGRSAGFSCMMVYEGAFGFGTLTSFGWP